MSITQEDLDEMLERNPDLKRVQADSVVAWQAIPIDVVAQIQGSKRKNKYNVSAKEDRTYGGITYSSKKECKFAMDLDILVRSGSIDFWLRQVPFYLGGNPPITYRADFVTFARVATHPKLLLVTVYEVKGMETPEWKLKHKLFKAKYPNLTQEII
jgi:hypothetical protein